MKLTDGEKLILTMLCELYEKMKVDGGIDPKFIRSAIYRDHTWAIGWEYTGIPFERKDAPPIVKEVVEVLDMWGFIEEAYEVLSEEDKAIIEKEADPFGKDPKFSGFDGNNEASHMSVAMFLVDDLGRFQRFKGRDMNSHVPSVDTYKRMYRIFETMRVDLIRGRLNVNQLIEILKEQVHPDYR
jgi:uncharacterized protein